jgi:hypothetical protein
MLAQRDLYGDGDIKNFENFVNQSNLKMTALESLVVRKVSIQTNII